MIQPSYPITACWSLHAQLAALGKPVISSLFGSVPVLQTLLNASCLSWWLQSPPPPPTQKTLFGFEKQMVEKPIEVQQLTQKHAGVLLSTFSCSVFYYKNCWVTLWKSLKICKSFLNEGNNLFEKHWTAFWHLPMLFSKQKCAMYFRFPNTSEQLQK